MLDAPDQSGFSLGIIGMKRALAVLVSAVFILLCLEVGLRLFGPFKQAGKTPDNILWQPNTQIGFAPASNLDTVVYAAEWMSHMITNEFGFRTARALPVVNRPASESILFLGDSQTMGEQVPAEVTFVSIVEGELA